MSYVVFNAFSVLPEKASRQAGRHAWPFLCWTRWPQYVCLCARKMSRVELYSSWQLLVFTARITRPRCPDGTVPLNNNWLLFPLTRSRDSSVGVVTRLRAGRLMNRRLIPGSGRKLFFSNCHQRIRGPYGLPWNGHRCLSSQDKATRAWNWLILSQRSRLVGSVHPLPVCLHGLVFN